MSPVRAAAARKPAPAGLHPAVPLLALYFALAALYAWQADRHPVPTIFTDEVEMAQLSRAIAETGEPARRGVPYDGLASLTAYLIAPAWWLGSTTAAYGAAKLLLVLAMTGAVFPAYGLGRLVLPRWYALAAAGAAVAVPALAYSPILVEEPLAYLASTSALWLIARALAAPGAGRVAIALLAAGTAALARTQLAVLFAVLALGLLWRAWSSERVARWRGTWTGWDRVGAVVLAVGAVLAFSALMGHLSTSWRETTGFFKDRIFHHAVWAMGALAVGIGVLPLLAGVASLARPRGERMDAGTRAFVATSVAAVAAFAWYAGIKGAYLQNEFSTLVVERNVIYLYPLLFVGAALAVARGVGRGWALALAAAATLYLVSAVPLRLDQYPYYEAHGLAIASFANRELGWSEGRIERALLVVAAASLAVLLALRILRRGSHAYHALAAAASVLVVAWSLTAEVYAAEGERILSTRIEKNLPRPFDWVDRATGGAPTVVIGQRMIDPTGVHLIEFFNRSVRTMWSLDGTAPGPGPILTPDLAQVDGTLTPSPGAAYALAVNGVTLQAPVVARRESSVLYRLDGGPMRLKEATVGPDSDGWVTDPDGDGVATASYTRYDVSGDGPGFAVVTLSRVAWCGGGPEGRATVRIGPVGIGPDKQPAIAHVTQERTIRVRNCRANGLVLAAPRVPWRVEVAISPTFSPHDIVPAHSDRRRLGAVLTVRFQPLFAQP